jgi:hypothetical protein
VIPTEKNSTRSLKECLVTINRSILFVEVGVVGNSLLSFSNNWEDEGLSILRTIGTDTKVDFLGVSIVFVSNGKRKDGIGGGLSNMAELTFSKRLGGLRRDELFIKLS